MWTEWEALKYEDCALHELAGRVNLAWGHMGVKGVGVGSGGAVAGHVRRVRGGCTGKKPPTTQTLLGVDAAGGGAKPIRSTGLYGYLGAAATTSCGFLKALAPNRGRLKLIVLSRWRQTGHHPSFEARQIRLEL